MCAADVWFDQDVTGGESGKHTQTETGHDGKTAKDASFQFE
jgi:hypothetical protein